MRLQDRNTHIAPGEVALVYKPAEPEVRATQGPAGKNSQDVPVGEQGKILRKPLEELEVEWVG